MESGIMPFQMQLKSSILYDLDGHW